MMSNVEHRWYFPEDTTIREIGANSLKFDTSDDAVKMFVRELCQNSTDASSGGRVDVEFEMFDLPSSDFPDRDGFVHTLERCLNTVASLQEDRSSYALLSDMKELILQPSITILRASDFGTLGACGSDVSEAAMSTPWKSMTISQGISDKGGKSAGSFGRGKDSFFAVSQFHTVFFSTIDVNGHRASIGCSELITHFDGGTKYASFGICGDRQYKNNYAILDTLSLGKFNRAPDQFGTDLYIMGYAQASPDWEDRILIAAIRDFFVKIQKGLLTVKAGSRIVNSENLEKTIRRLIIAYPLEESDLSLVLEQLDLLKEEPFNRNDIFSLYLKKSDRYNQIVSVRSGMVIDRHYKSIPSAIGLLIIEDDEASKLLSKCEPTNHNKWVRSNIQNLAREYKSKIVKLLDDISKSVNISISNFIGSQADEVQDAEGLEKYLSLHKDSPEQIQVARKEFNWGVIATVKPKRKNKVKKRREDPLSPKQNPVELMASEKEPEEGFEPTGAVDRDSKPRGEASRNFAPNPEGDMKRKFKISTGIKMTDVTEACNRDNGPLECTFIFNINKEQEYYVRVSAIMRGGKSAEQVPLLSVKDINGKEYPIVDGYYAGPIVSSTFFRNQITVILDYPSICDFRPEVFEHAD